MADYSKMTDQEFDSILEEIVGEMSAAQILAYGNVNMVLREELNNEVLDRWEKKNPDKAFPEPEVDDEVKFCPECERPNQFGELCNSCREEMDREREAADVDQDEARQEEADQERTEAPDGSGHQLNGGDETAS